MSCKNFLHHTTTSNHIQQLRTALQCADAIVLGAGAGLSTSAGFLYSGPRFQTYFSDFAAQYAFYDMYAGGFYPYKTLEEYWAFWSRNIWINRYISAPKPVYSQLYTLLHEKDYFILTTNVDHQFQKAGFDKKRLFYTQGDYGLLQCSTPCHKKTYNNKNLVRAMLEAQGFQIHKDNTLSLPNKIPLQIQIPPELIPLCPHCGKPMTMNLRIDNSFVEEEGWHLAAQRYHEFLRRHSSLRTLYLELGVGHNTPSIIKYSFWEKTMQQPQSTYACINLDDAYAPEEIQTQSICIHGDIGKILEQI